MVSQTARAKSLLHSGKKLIEEISSRAVHLKLYPPPRNLHETCGILQTIQDYGNVQSYRPLRRAPDSTLRAPSSILVIFQNKTDAANLVNNSPFEFDIPPAQPPDQSLNLLNIADVPFDEKQDSEDTQSYEFRETKEKEPTTFYMEVERSRTNHLGFIQRQEYYWSFKEQKWSLISERLAEHDYIMRTPGLATMSEKQNQLPSRFVNNWLSRIDEHKTLQELYMTGKERKEHG